MNLNLFNQVVDIFRDVFDDVELVINAETTSDQIPDWDSLAHISLVTSIERHFKIKFALGELQSLRNVGEMIALIEKKKV
jgi:acyl carrier protein